MPFLGDMLVPWRVRLNIPRNLKHLQRTRTWKSPPRYRWTTFRTFGSMVFSSVFNIFCTAPARKTRPKDNWEGCFSWWFWAFLWIISLPSSLKIHSFLAPNYPWGFSESVTTFVGGNQVSKEYILKGYNCHLPWRIAKKVACIWQVIFVQPMQRPAADSQRVTLHFKIYP